MQQVSSEVIITYFAFLAFWVGLVAIVLIGARWSLRLRGWREQMLAQWKPALAIALLSWISVGLSGRGWVNPSAVGIFCEAMIGLALARSLVGFEPLPVARAVAQHERRWFVRVALMVLLALVLIVPVLIVGSIGMAIGQQVFHETNATREAQGSLSFNWWQAFFALLSGAGIAEETVYRLVVISLVWRVTRSPWLGVIVSAVLFGAYHLTPLSGMYLIFWKMPASQFLGSAFIGLVWGWLYIKRGYETAVLAHTFQDWVPLALFTVMGG